MTVYIGVDPGNDGGLAMVDSTGVAIEYERMPTVKGIDYFFLNATHSAAGQQVVCIFEEHKGGKAGMSSADAHKSAGRYLGMIQMVCEVYGIKMICVTPQEWKSHFGLISRAKKGAFKPTDKEKRAAAKAASIVLCKLHFPGINLLATPKCTTEHDGIAESLLLARYGQLKRLK